MKVETSTCVTDFTPVRFTLVIESRKELNNLYNLFSYTPVLRALGIANSCTPVFIREELKNLGAGDSDSDSWMAFTSHFKR